MAVYNAGMRFTNLVANWHGSTHDSAVFNTNALQQHMETRKKGGWLLGESGYVLRLYLMTHLNADKVKTLGKEKYQRRHTKTQNVIERSFGLLKQRFLCLVFFWGGGGGMRCSPDRCSPEYVHSGQQLTTSWPGGN